MSNPINAPRISPTLSLSQASYFSSPLLSKINWAFWFCVTATASYCLYNLYQALQLKQHTGLALDDRFKLARCQALYAEAQEKKDLADAQPLLEQCEDLLSFISDKTHSHDKEYLLVNIACYYAKNAPARSYSIARQFSSSHSMLKVAQKLQKEHPDFFGLCTLFIEAFELNFKELKKPSAELGKMLTFAKAFASFHKNNISHVVKICMGKAIEIAKGHEDPLDQFRMYCQIAQCYHEMENPEQARSSIESAQKLFPNIIAGSEVIAARLSLANTFFSIGNLYAMDQELGEVVDWMEKNAQSPISAKNLYPLAKLIDKIKKNDQVELPYKNYAVEGLINKAFEALGEEIYKENRKETALTIASIYQEGLLNDTDTKVRALYIAFEEINSLPDETDELLNPKIESLILLSHYFENDRNNTLNLATMLESLYDRCPVEFDRNSRLRREKPSLGMQILEIYNKAGLKEVSDAFFRKYLLDLQSGKDIFEKINLLTSYATGTPEQKKAQLEAAEALLPQTDSSSSYKHALSLIIEGYSKINPQKSVELLNNYENRQANWCIVTAVAIPALMGISYYFPTAGLVISGVSSVARLWTQM